jgi:FKBP-type peptidyl-prolyl cis-trans isomerase FklB
MQKKYMEREKAAAEIAIKEGEAWLTENGKKPGVTTTASGMQYEVIAQGTGPRATIKDQVKVNYRGTLVNGEEFDSSERHGGPATFGLTNVVAGWTEALQLMPTGSKWRLYLPAHLGADGLQGAPGIPAHSVLIFDVELLEVIKAQ